MVPPTSPKDVASTLLAQHGLRLQTIQSLQSLWAGYGQICRVTVDNESLKDHSEDSTTSHLQSYILKLVTPPPTKATDEGHARKILSYRVEQYFYTKLAPQMPGSIPVAKCIASINEQRPDGTSMTAMILTDLRQRYPVAGEKRDVLTSTQIFAVLDWLSGFHGFWWSKTENFDRSKLVRPPLEEVQAETQNISEKAVWLNGGYTYLATRRTEYSRLASDHNDEWSSLLTAHVPGTNHDIAEVASIFLAPTTKGRAATTDYQTLIHGDVKSENLFTSNSGEQVAFYDFQYVGLGLGVCDLAKLFTCSVPLDMLVSSRSIPRELEMQSGEKKLLRRYWERLREVSGKEYDWSVFVMHWETALVDWLRFQASWGFWGNTEWLEARVRRILDDQAWKDALMRGVADVEALGGGDA